MPRLSPLDDSRRLRRAAAAVRPRPATYANAEPSFEVLRGRSNAAEVMRLGSHTDRIRPAQRAAFASRKPFALDPVAGNTTLVGSTGFFVNGCAFTIPADGRCQSIGTSYCGPAVTNSTGAAAVIYAIGSSAVLDHDVTLHETQLPPRSFGLFLTSTSQGFSPMPAASLGNLCLGGPIGRLVAPGQVMPSNAAGEVSLQLGLMNHPTPTGPVAVAPMDTWNFQFWFRDLSGGASGSNFTDGLRIVFE